MALPVHLARDVRHELRRELEDVLQREEQELPGRQVRPCRAREDESLREAEKDDGARGGERQRREAGGPERRAAAGEEGNRKRIEEEFTRVRQDRKEETDLSPARLGAGRPRRRRRGGKPEAD